MHTYAHTCTYMCVCVCIDMGVFCLDLRGNIPSKDYIFFSFNNFIELYSLNSSEKIRRTRHAGHCWRSRDELISDVLLWAPTYGRAKASMNLHTAAM